MTARRALVLLCAGHGAALVALIVHVGDPARADWWPVALAFLPWVTAPAILPWPIGRGRTERARVMLVYAALALASGAAAYGHAFFVSHSSTAALAFVGVPLVQNGVLAVLWVWLRLSRRPQG